MNSKQIKYKIKMQGDNYIN